MKDNSLQILSLPQDNIELFIAEKCKIYTPFTVAAEFGLDKSYVNSICKKYLINEYLASIKSINIVITSFQEQIILGGLIGDGRIKINGESSYIYSECHVMDERQYCEWKYFNLGDLTKGIRMYGKNFNNQYSKAIEFCTRSTPLLGIYANMSKLETISKLDVVGLMICILDDGWFSKHSKAGNFVLSGGNMSIEELELLCERYKSIGLNCKIIGQKRKDISFSSNDNLKILTYVGSFMPTTIDVCMKKFGYIFQTLLTYNDRSIRDPNGRHILHYE